MKVPTQKSAMTFVCVSALLVACQDLNLADEVQSSSAAAGKGGTSHTGGGSTKMGGNSTTGGSSTTTPASGGAMVLGGASSQTVASSGGAPYSAKPSSSGDSTTGGTSSAPFAIGSAAPLGGTQSRGGSQGFGGLGGVASSAGAPVAGGSAATGGVPLAPGGQSSTALLSGGTFSNGGNAAAAGEPATGGTVSAGGGVSGAGGSSSPPELGQGGGLGSGGTTSSSSSRQDALKWQPCLSTLNQYVTTFAQSPQSVNNMLVGCSNGDVYLTFDGLSMDPNPHWIRVDNWTTIGGAEMGMPGLPVNAIAYSPADVNTAYIAFAGSKQGKKLWKTTTNGSYWSEITSSPLAEIWAISVNPLDPQRVYIFGPGGAYMSPDAGDTWTDDVTTAPMNVPIAAGANLSTVSVAPNQPDVIWVGATNGDVFFTNDATTNQTWYQATKHMPTRAVTHLALDTSRTPIRVYATFDGMGPDSLWVTSNHGIVWAVLQNEGLPAGPTVPGIYAFYGVSINPIDSSVLYVGGTYGAGFSTSAGTTWTWTSL